jgi:aspartyl-tRNA(Asn)/glutamyl-tRNA(Gln) amidotransferase subunit C
MRASWSPALQKNRPFLYAVAMSLNREDILKLAELARLQLSEAELVSAEKELDAVLGYVDRLKDVDTGGVDPLTMPAKAEGWRGDVALPCDDLARELILSNFPSRTDDLLRTPAVFEKPKGMKLET